jgi:hypothetical protein
MISPKLFPDAMVMRAAASCNTMAAPMENVSAHNN